MKRLLIIFFYIQLINICSFQVSKLSHVIIPFHFKQIDNVAKNLETWKINIPCKQKSKIGLIFFVGMKYNRTIKNLVLEKVRFINVTQCFQYYTVDFSADGENTYLRGARLMFEQMLKKNLSFGNISISHVFYMEPDSVPIRPQWLEALNNNIIFPNQKFWIKGSIYRGTHDIITNRFLNHYHINGNAIYNLQHNEFLKFYENIVRKHTLKKNGLHLFDKTAYDMDIFDAIFFENLRFSSKYAHYFQISDFIQNYYHSNHSLSHIFINSPNTFFIHGGKNIDEKK